MSSILLYTRTARFSDYKVTSLTTTFHLLTTLYAPLLDSGVFEPVEFSGWEVIRYYIYLIQNFFSGYSWQIVTSYHITLYSCIMLAGLFILFWIKVTKASRRKAKAQKIFEEYEPYMLQILGAWEEMDGQQMLALMGKTEKDISKIHPLYFAQMLEKKRMDLYEIVFLPNMQRLANTLGVTEYLEKQLLQRKNVFNSLQLLLFLQLTVVEGRLANYVNHTNDEIRMMARLCYISCSADDPYRFLKADLDIKQSLFRPMLLNYVFGWMKSQNRNMPAFLTLASALENEDSAAYLVKEVAYWGTEQEKEDVKDFLLSDKMPVREAAIEVISMLCDRDAEDALVKSYYRQPEDLRRKTLEALLALNSGKQLEFFKQAYENASTRQTRETALNCIYLYGNEGRREFEIIRSTADADTRRMIDQIDANSILTQMRGLAI